MNSFLIRILISMPVIILATYLTPLLGLALVIMRCFAKDDRHLRTSLILMTIGAVLCLPKLLRIINHQALARLREGGYWNLAIYDHQLLSLAQNLIIIAIFAAIIMKIIWIIKSKLVNRVGRYLHQLDRREREIARDNNLKIQEKQQRAKQTAYVQCPNCGSDNLVSDGQAVCKFCRTPLINPKINKS